MVAHERGLSRHARFLEAALKWSQTESRFFFVVTVLLFE